MPRLSKLTRPFFRPALDDHLFIGEELDSVPSLPEQHTEKTVFPAAEREVRHRRGHTYIHAYITSGRFIAKLTRGGSAGGEDRSGVGVLASAENRQCLVEILGLMHGEYRAENLGGGEF